MRRAKIVCTLGPATASPARIGRLIDAGMDVARLNASHGDHRGLAALLEAVRGESSKRGRAVAVLLDLQGPKIRVGKFADGQVTLASGAEFTITTEDVVGDEHRVSTSYSGLPGDVQTGDHILLDDGYLGLAVTDVRDNAVMTRVISGGVLRDNKGINLPGVEVSAPALTDKDRADLAWGMRMGVDYLALSFVRKPEDVLEARRLATADGQSVPIIAKIEKPQAIDRLEEIVSEADGIMVARGDLGVELGPEKVPLVQKRIIKATNDQGKIVITATQMLESMIQHPRPTRAEASDVANAVLDGTDAVMLSGETAVGDHPVEAVRTMSRIITEIEQSAHFWHELEPTRIDLPVSANAIAHAATIAAREMDIDAICVVTESGGAARLMSEYRPEARIFAFTISEVTFRRLAAYWGVTPIMTHPAATGDEVTEAIEHELSAHDLARPGQYVVVTMATPVGAGLTTNTLKIHQMR